MNTDGIFRIQYVYYTRYLVLYVSFLTALPCIDCKYAPVQKVKFCVKSSWFVFIPFKASVFIFCNLLENIAIRYCQMFVFFQYITLSWILMALSQMPTMFRQNELFTFMKF